MTDMERSDTGTAAQEKRAKLPEQAAREERASEAASKASEHSGAVAVSSAEVRGPGWITYAGVVLVVAGLFEAIWGVTALFRTTYYLVPASGLVIGYDYAVWGWVHIGLAVLLVLTGLAVFAGQPWARYVGICLAALGMLANFLTITALPFWSLIMIAIDILVIYALAVHGRDMKRLRT
jgi:hypothetical protein